MNHVIHGLVLAKEREKLLNQAKWSMVWHFNELGTTRHALLITDVSLRLGDKEHTLTITLERPGLLIGKAGRHIDALRDRLTSGLGHPIKIEIIEDKKWAGIYAEASY
jgi:ribosomal protein S3